MNPGNQRLERLTESGSQALAVYPVGMKRKRAAAASTAGMSLLDVINNTVDILDAGSRTGLQMIGFTPNPGPQQAFMRSTADETLYGGAAGGGKAGRCPDRAAPSYTEDMETKVLTPKGFKLFGDMRVGDMICNPDGTTSRIIQVHEQGIQQFYRVTLSDGSSVEASEGHLWAISMAGSRKRRKHPPTITPTTSDAAANWNAQLMARTRIVTTKELMTLVEREERKRGSKSNRAYSVQLPLTAPVAFTAAPGRWPTLPPYTLGVLIGDGSLVGDCTRFTTADPEMADRIQAENPGYVLTSSGKTGTPARDYRITGKADGESARKKLERDGLWGKYASEKFIPNRIKHSPPEIRWAFMQGLFDADGYIDERGHVEFVTISHALALDVQWVCRSLGLKATLSGKNPTYTHNGEKWAGEPAHRLYIRGHDQHRLFSLPRKADRARRFNGGDVMPSHRVVSVIPTEKDNARCITVDHPNSMYVTDDFIVTHNSAALVAKAAEHMHVPGHHAVMFRRTNPQLFGSGGLIDKSREFYARSPFFWRAGMVRWENPGTGGTVDFRHLARESDLENYIGQEFTELDIDELTHFTEYEYLILRSRLRSPNPSIRPRSNAATNPGGRGHEWVRKRWRAWLDPKYASIFTDRDGVEHHFGPAAPGEIRAYIRLEDVDTEVPVGYPGSQTRTYIAAKVTDNPYLMQNMEYMNTLQNLPELERKRLLEGDWNVYQEGGIFKHHYFKRIMEHELPRGLRWHRGFDLAGSYQTRNDRSAYAEVASDQEGNVYIRKVWAGRIDWPTQRRQFRAVMLSPSGGGIQTWNGIEYASNGIPLFQEFQNDPTLNGYVIKAINPGSADKVTRAQPLASKGAAGKLFIVDDDWTDATIDEFVLFGNKDEHDDRVDATVIGFLMSIQAAVVVSSYA